MHQRLGHRSTRSLIAGESANIWEDVELRIDPDRFCTSCKMGLDLFLALHLPRDWQYLQLSMIWYICALISDASILKQFSFLLDFSLTSPYFFLKMRVFSVHYAVMLLYYPLLLRSTLCKTLCEKRHVCPALINVMMENNLSHKSGVNSTLYKVTTKVFPLSSHICICNELFFLRYVMSVRNFNEFIRIL